MGRVAVDLYAEQIHSPLEDAQSFRRYLGGCAGNIAVGTSRLGLRSAMLSCVGTDDMGKFLRKQLRQEGVDTTLLQDTDDHLTALVLLGVSPPNRFPLIFYRENCADMQIQPEHADPAVFQQAKALQFTGTGLSTPAMLEASKHAIKVAKEAGCAVILDIDYRPVLWGLTAAGDGESRFVASEAVTSVLQPLLPNLDLIIGTEEEVMIAGGGESLEASLQAIRKLSTATIVLKRGEQGCEVFTTSATASIKARSFPIEVLNILGAGDAFASGFLRGWLRDEPLETCALWGNANGALTVTRHGCSPAMASFDELQHLIEHFDRDPKVLSSPTLLKLHQRTVLGRPRNLPLKVLAFDHRGQFEKTCKLQGIASSQISEFKNLVFEGFKRVNAENCGESLALLVDPQFGGDILQESAYGDYHVGTPIERSGSFPVEWLTEKNLYEYLVQCPSTWFVKVLWNFHPHLETEKKREQLALLQKLQSVCDALERRLMLEMILPEGLSKNGEMLALAIEEVYAHQLFPYWWKISPTDTQAEWEQVTSTLDRYDPEAGVIVLGNNAPLAQFEKWFRIVRSTPHACGFAIGRSIFWEPWLEFASGSMEAQAVPARIAERYQQMIDLWRHSETALPA